MLRDLRHLEALHPEIGGDALEVRHPQSIELWTPLVMSPRVEASWDARPLRVAARL